MQSARQRRERRKPRALNGAVTIDSTTPRRRLAPEDQVAEVLHVSIQSLKNARSTMTGDLASLRWYKIGPRVLYDMDYLEGPWLEQRRRGDEATKG